MRNRSKTPFLENQKRYSNTNSNNEINNHSGFKTSVHQTLYHNTATHNYNDPYYWGSDWSWCAILVAAFGFFFILVLLVALVPYGTCSNRTCDSYGRCYCYDGHSSYPYVPPSLSKNIQKHVKYAKNNGGIQYIDQKHKTMEKIVNETLISKAQDCSKGMHPWVDMSSEK